MANVTLNPPPQKDRENQKANVKQDNLPAGKMKCTGKPVVMLEIEALRLS